MNNTRMICIEFSGKRKSYKPWLAALALFSAFSFYAGFTNNEPLTAPVTRAEKIACLNAGGSEEACGIWAPVYKQGE